MIDPAFFCDALARHGTDFFTGVPDSLLKSFCAFAGARYGGSSHITAVNEGAAVALAAGWHLATGKVPLVYMQNSGIGNAVNPLLSLADREVYRIPLLLLIGWRGEPGVHDEPQHVKQGRVTPALLDAMEIPFAVLSPEEAGAEKQIDSAFAWLEKNGAPFAFLVRKDTFAPFQDDGKNAGNGSRAAGNAALSREGAIEEIIRALPPEEIYFSTTGMASRELYELREKYGQGHGRDFLAVGSMGHASSLALAAALQKPEMSFTCLDGDGAALMHLGALAAVGARRPRNLRHIVFNNGAHDSVGGQPTIARDIDLSGIARACGYARVFRARNGAELREILEKNGNAEREGPEFIEVMIRKGARQDLGRPQGSPEENKNALAGILRRSPRGKDGT